MRLHRPSSPPGDASTGGAALLLSLLVLLVLVAIISQINIATSTDARVGRNDLALTTMDLAIESALLEVAETLSADAEATSAEDAGAAPPNPFEGAAQGEEGGEEGPVDSRQDDWATPMRTEINGIRLRILIQDEDSKLNVLTMLSEDEEEAEKAFERVVRVLDYCRGDTEADIEEKDARAMAIQMREHLEDRANSFLPRPTLLTDDEEEQTEVGLPLSLREFVCLEAFTEDHFRDFRDEDGKVVHSITSFLTCWTALTTYDELNNEEEGSTPGGPGRPEEGSEETDAGETSQETGFGEEEGANPFNPTSTSAETGTSGTGPGGPSGPSSTSGIAVNVNTSPPAVLKALMDDRDVAPRLWDDVVAWRNEEDEEALGEDEEPPLDEFGEEILIPKIFESVMDLEEFDEFRDLDALVKGELMNLLTVESHVFSIYVTARKPTGVSAGLDFAGSREEVLEEEEKGTALARTVRCTVWRREGADGWELVPLERWEVLDYMPFEVLDIPEEDR